MNISQAAKSLGRRRGLKGSPARAAKLSPERRKEIGKNAIAVRWQKMRENQARLDKEAPKGGNGPLSLWPLTFKEVLEHCAKTKIKQRHKYIRWTKEKEDVLIAVYEEYGSLRIVSRILKIPRTTIIAKINSLRGKGRQIMKFHSPAAAKLNLSVLADLAKKELK